MSEESHNDESDEECRRDGGQSERNEKSAFRSSPCAAIEKTAADIGEPEGEGEVWGGAPSPSRLHGPSRALLHGLEVGEEVEEIIERLRIPGEGEGGRRPRDGGVEVGRRRFGVLLQRLSVFAPSLSSSVAIVSVLFGLNLISSDSPFSLFGWREGMTGGEGGLGCSIFSPFFFYSLLSTVLFLLFCSSIGIQLR
uniref:Uncharacterized protein n=1 Tax=Chromera velia CCMP2878 TaxID=1169474 RepID=A0A0G4GHA3_9ALVE|eukprot:Cvel_21908.t1-p1 / transcript=Cvel_21908.t1 / gene=Cvel_21908 / organism=Chromera_velia_CCMP2878 / gene_product=hypothetical protein / transcript_product=hypothetical protein / location=Cvel_scaffold2099:20762-21343(-) / protein_length=194 / sequence_SO=supercontig / SO=protein_coding / is_pseudo=false